MGAREAHYIGLIEHKQPECAETFFNSVSCQILHRTYFHNRFIFVRPTVSTEHIEADPPTYRSYYPLVQGARNALIDIVLDFRLGTRFADFRRDLAHFRRLRTCTPRPYCPRPTTRSRCSRRCFRDQTAYAVGRVNGMHEAPFAVALKYTADGRPTSMRVMIRHRAGAAFFGEPPFPVDMEKPSAYVNFCAIPDKTASEL